MRKAVLVVLLLLSPWIGSTLSDLIVDPAADADVVALDDGGPWPPPPSPNP